MEKYKIYPQLINNNEKNDLKKQAREIDQELIIFDTDWENVSVIIVAKDPSTDVEEHSVVTEELSIITKDLLNLSGMTEKALYDEAIENLKQLPFEFEKIELKDDETPDNSVNVYDLRGYDGFEAARILLKDEVDAFDFAKKDGLYYSIPAVNILAIFEGNEAEQFGEFSAQAKYSEASKTGDELTTKVYKF